MSTIKVDTYLTRGGASEIAIDKLKGVSSASSISVVAEGGTNTTNLQQGLAKAWVNFNGSGTVATRDTHNISSINDVTTGQYEPNFSNNMASANYTVTLVNGDNHYVTTLHNSLVQAGSYRMHNLNNSGSYADSTIIMSNVNGDLA